MNNNNDHHNLINNQNNPEHLYCMVQTGKKTDINYIDVTALINALQQIQFEQNLVIPNLNLLGQFNFASADQMERKVIQPIIGSNMNISSEIIRNGKLIYCCKILQQQAKKYFYYTLAILSIIACLLTIGYLIYITRYDAGPQALFGIHILIYYFQITILIFSVTKANLRLLRLNIIFAIISFIFCIAITLLSIIQERNSDKNIGLILAIEAPSQTFLILCLISYGYLAEKIQRFLVLVNQLDQTEFLKNYFLINN